jgi:hypothetical protein
MRPAAAVDHLGMTRQRSHKTTLPASPRLRAQRVTWYSELERLVKARWAIGHDFTAEKVYDFDEHFRPLYPQNCTRKASLQRTMQLLRDRGIVEFVDNNGTYKRLK